MDWIPLDVPRPEDGKHYDIRLNTGEVIFDVTYWDFGGGFSPLDLEESSGPDGCPVKYPKSVVAGYRPTSCTSENR
jgi:hypothetical protein